MEAGRGSSIILCLPASVVAAACGMHRYVPRKSTIAEACCRIRGRVPDAARTERAVQHRVDLAADEVVAEAVRGSGSTALAKVIAQARSAQLSSAGKAVPPDVPPSSLLPAGVRQCAVLAPEGDHSAAAAAANGGGRALMRSLVAAEATLCGPPDDAPASVGATDARSSRETVDGAARKAQQKYCAALRSALTEAIEARAVSAPASASASCGAGDRVEKPGSAEQGSSMLKAHLRAHVDSWVGRSGGVAQEESIIRTFERQAGTNVQSRNDRTGVLRVGGTGIAVVGKVDGIDASTGMVVEAKQRKSRLFSCVPIYERVQCEVYARMFDTPGAIHVQRFGDEVVSTRLPRDDALWVKIRHKLVGFERDVVRTLALPDGDIDSFIVEASRDTPLRAWAFSRGPARQQRGTRQQRSGAQRS